MKITPDQNQGMPIEPPSAPAVQAKSERVSTQSSTASTIDNATAAAGAAVVAPVQRQTDVTFRRDSNGRIYYVVSDAKSGAEILEIPPKSIRDLDQGIDEYVEEEQSKAGPHVEVKA
ncbi:MAG TPA: hypothetical protein VMU53_02595 [Candidatus Sulfotelmatobacter sp.]|nr:hypothetical protein [Candidatus Sulfotelmatobacter sp.]